MRISLLVALPLSLAACAAEDPPAVPDAPPGAAIEDELSVDDDLSAEDGALEDGSIEPGDPLGVPEVEPDSRPAPAPGGSLTYT